MGSSGTVSEGNAILGHILGSKDVSRSVASNAASVTGIGEDTLKKMLPVLATLAMAALSRQTASAGTGQLSQASMTDSISSLGSFLDMNRDGSVADDVMGLVGKLFGGRRTVTSCGLRVTRTSGQRAGLRHARRRALCVSNS